MSRARAALEQQLEVDVIGAGSRIVGGDLLSVASLGGGLRRHIAGGRDRADQSADLTGIDPFIRRNARIITNAIHERCTLKNGRPIAESEKRMADARDFIARRTAG